MDPAFTFHHDLRVRYVETDAQAVVYHANYLVYCDAARVEYFRALAGGQAPWREERDYDIVLVHASLDFRASARFDDPLRVWVRIEKVGNSSFAFGYRIMRGDELCAEAKTVHVAIDRQARSARPIPDELRQRLGAWPPASARRVLPRAASQ
jgi:acyl-CoA thioester hydrolase